MTNEAVTNTSKGSVHTIAVSRKIRLLLWGGAYATSDNNTFDKAKREVIRDYKQSDNNRFSIIDIRIDSAQEFLAATNKQKANSIRSLDVFTHGGPDHFYMVSVREEKDGWPNNLRWYRYAAHNASFSRADLAKIHFLNFTNDAKIEFQGCQTAANPTDENNIAADFSSRLKEAGKTRSSVIGHTTNAVPGIDPNDKPRQDYRHGSRAIFKRGTLVKITRQHGAIDEKWLAQ
ncbi:hypothetical protein MNJPNG_27390 [Cupriavidus oxalaticus]|uniref:hypothetical protein n=1 Tax=Cupriavidus oxalaticus TaxID=96344 RepID=UPI003F73F170